MADFHVDLFGCDPVREERDLSAPWLEEAVGVPGARVRGIHRVLDAGRSALGGMVTKAIPKAGAITFAYLRDPEEDSLEIQRWTVS